MHWRAVQRLGRLKGVVCLGHGVFALLQVDAQADRAAAYTLSVCDLTDQANRNDLSLCKQRLGYDDGQRCRCDGGVWIRRRSAQGYPIGKIASAGGQVTLS